MLHLVIKRSKKMTTAVGFFWGDCFVSHRHPPRHLCFWIYCASPFIVSSAPLQLFLNCPRIQCFREIPCILLCNIGDKHWAWQENRLEYETRTIPQRNSPVCFLFCCTVLNTSFSLNTFMTGLSGDELQCSTLDGPSIGRGGFQCFNDFCFPMGPH